MLCAPPAGTDRRTAASGAGRGPPGGRSDAAPAALLLLAADTLAALGEGVVGELDQVERVDADRGPGQVLTQGLPERRRRIDRDDIDLLAPVQAAGA